MFNLKKQNILITGGFGHLGLSMTEGLLNQGANLIVLTKSLKTIKREGISKR